MASFANSEEVLSGIRKLLQDLVAPEVSGLKATLTALVDGQKLMREDMQAIEARLSADIQATRGEIGTSEARVIDRIEQSKREIMLAVENRFLKEEVEQLRKRLEPPTQ